jgi:hypothetical protein
MIHLDVHELADITSESSRQVTIEPDAYGQACTVIKFERRVNQTSNRRYC